jgi:small-conductance mechanosensitive channel
MKFLIVLVFTLSTLLAIDENITKEDNRTNTLLLQQQTKQLLKVAEEKKSQEERLRRSKIESYLIELNQLESKIAQEQVWMKSYSSYLTSLDVRTSLKKIRDKIATIKGSDVHNLDKDKLSSLISREKILATQVERLSKKDSALFSKLLTPPTIANIPVITNPFDIFTAISFIKTINVDSMEYIQRKEKIKNLIKLIRKENDIYIAISKLDKEGKYRKKAKEKAKQLERFETAFDTIVVTSEIYQKRLEVIEANIEKEIQKQIYRLINIGVIIFVVILIFFLLKLFIKKYIVDNDRFYMANKIINFINITLIVLILFFNYIENASYLVTILGFASAGIAIAMKDWFMSILGWLVIVFGGSIHVGDRIRVDMDGMKYVGDVMDISLLRMTILEDITLTSIMQNRRAGRIIFVPNNYIFTRMIANYTHSSLKTVWDGIKITITFDSNHKKAMHIVKIITKKYSKGYTDITRKQLNKLRNNYNLKNTNVEPRIFSFISHSGLDIEAWYLTNAYGTLTLRSTISAEIVDAFNVEDDITIAYTTQKLNISMRSEQTAPHEHEMV